MAKKWTEKAIDSFVESNGGDSMALLDEFPFSKESLDEINKAYADEDNYTDSDVADLVLELAYKEIDK